MGQNEKGNIQSYMEEGMISSLLEGIMPKIIPMIKPAIQKFTEYLGDEDKTIIIRRKKDKDPLVIIFDNKKDFNITGTSVNGEDGAVINIYNIKEFIEKLMEGGINF